MRSVDTSGKTKHAEYIAALMMEDIYNIGCTNVVAVVTDTCATTCQKRGICHGRVLPWISAIPCVPHVISLLMKDIGHVKEVEQLIQEETVVVGWYACTASYR